MWKEDSSIKYEVTHAQYAQTESSLIQAKLHTAKHPMNAPLPYTPKPDIYGYLVKFSLYLGEKWSDFHSVKWLLISENILFKAIKLANGPGHFLDVLQYLQQ